MGESGRIHVEYGIDGPGSSGEFSQRTWMGAIYGCGNPGTGGGRQTPCLYPVGQSGTEESRDDHEPEASDHSIPTP